MKLSDQELIAIGLNVQSWRKKGGKSVLKKRGNSWFKELNKKSIAKRRENKIKRESEAKTD